MGAKRVLIVLLVLACLAVVAIEAFVLHDETDLDTELEEYQIRVDYGKMAQGFLGLFYGGSSSDEGEKDGYTAPAASGGSATVHEPAAAHTPAPTVPTLQPYSGG